MTTATELRSIFLHRIPPASRLLVAAAGLGALVGGGYGLGLLSSEGAATREAGSATAADTEGKAPENFLDRGMPVADLPVNPGQEGTDDDGSSHTEGASDPGTSALTPLEQALAAPGAASAESSREAPTVEQVTPGAFYVQVSSFRSRQRAEERARALTAKGQNAQSYDGPSEGWHMVRLGPFKTRAEAEEQRLALARNERQQAYVLPRSNGLFHVQVASLESEKAAQRVAADYSAAGHTTKITRVRMAGRHWYCVRIGPFDTRDEALAYQKLVRDRPGIQSRVIPFEPRAT